MNGKNDSILMMKRPVIYLAIFEDKHYRASSYYKLGIDYMTFNINSLQYFAAFQLIFFNFIHYNTNLNL